MKYVTRYALILGLIGTLFITSSITASPAVSVNPNSGASAYVLCYHTFLGRPKVFTDFYMDEFKAQINGLKNKGFQFVTFADIKANKIKGNKNILVIIDDGNKTGYEAYFKVLKPLGIKPMLAIYPNVLGKTNYAMTWDQLKELILKEKCELASHGYYHLYMRDDFLAKDPKGFYLEIAGSKKKLEEKLGVKVDSFVYPFGVVSNSAKKVLKESGYTAAFSLKQAPLTWPYADALELPRYMLTRSEAKRILASIEK